ncbi:hypothetical protein AB0D37_06785 [Streptomyces sp. NPDC048384]|uniref:hypothetical protein n=1 Tax=Streptomyces sp. NPDC048384 TaxID=3155487 RepID=UPI00343B6CBC
MTCRFEMPDTKLHEAQANEYFNTETQQYEVVRYYGLYDVQETFLTPDGKILLLAYNVHAAMPWVVSEHDGIMNGVFWQEGEDARRNYAWLIAASFGLTVDKEGSKAVVPASREYATSLVQQIKQHTDALVKAVDEHDQDQAADALKDSANSLAKHLQRIGVLTQNVYDSREVVG